MILASPFLYYQVKAGLASLGAAGTLHLAVEVCPVLCRVNPLYAITVFLPPGL
jgi:hypothetical protein